MSVSRHTDEWRRVLGRLDRLIAIAEDRGRRYPGVQPPEARPDPVMPVQIPNSTPEEARTVFVLSEGGVQIGFADLAFGELLPVHVSVGNVRADAVIPLTLLRQMRDHLDGVLQRAAENPEPAA